MNHWTTVRIKPETKRRLKLDAIAKNKSVCGLLEQIVFEHYQASFQPSAIESTLLEQIRVSNSLLEQIRLVGTS